MKVVVTSYSDNVGKSMVANQLIAPRIDAPVISVESTNADDARNEASRGEPFMDFQRRLASLDATVVDVGASNVEAFLQMMEEYAGSHEDFDYFVIPCVPKPKQVRDTLATINALNSVGVAPDQIRVVFNKVDKRASFEATFRDIFKAHAADAIFTLSPDAVIYESDVFALLQGVPLATAAADTTDYKSQMKQTNDINQRVRLADLLATHRLAKGVQADFDRTFDALFR